MKKVVILLCILALAGLVSAVDAYNNLHVNIQTTFSNGSIETGTFAFVFNISNSSDCADANIVYSNSTSLATDSRGIISYYLPNVTLDYTQQYWLCYYKDGVLTDTSEIARVPYAFETKNTTLSGVSVDTNLNLSTYNATASHGFFNYLGDYLNKIVELIVGSIEFSGNINGSGNFTTTGYVGINTTNPQNLLNVLGDANITGSLYVNGAPVSGSGTISGGGTYGYIPMWNGTSSMNNSAVYQNGTNIGIGTTRPQSTFNVVGTGNFTSALSSYHLRADEGNTSLGRQAGNAEGGGNTANDITAIGHYAGYSGSGNYLAALGTWAGGINRAGYVTAIGAQAGNSNTVAGEYLTAIGFSAGTSNSGSSGTFAGSYAGYHNTGNYNTFAGYYSGYYNIGTTSAAIGYYSGNYNRGNYVTALGYYAGNGNNGSYAFLAGNSAGYRNIGEGVIIMGSDTGYLNTGNFTVSIGSGTAQYNSGNEAIIMGSGAGDHNTGNNLIGIGYYTGRTNSGRDTIALGYQAAYQNIGNYTTAIGYGAGYQNRGNYFVTLGNDAGNGNKGNYNNFIGYQAGSSNTGNYTTAIGYNAGYANTGDYLVALGYQAGRSNSGTNITGLGYNAGYLNSGNNSVFIGSGAGQSNTASNQFILKQASINSIPLMQGNFSSGYLGVNTTTPTNTFNVVGDANITGTLYAGGTSVGSGGAQWTSSGNNVYNSTTGVQVGIGTTTPQTLFHIGRTPNDIISYNFTKASALIVGKTDTSTGPDPGVLSAREPVLVLSRLGEAGVIYPAFVEFNVKRYEAISNLARTQLDITLAPSDSNSSNFVDVMSLMSNGNVGIGTTTPQGLLEVSGTTARVQIDTLNSANGGFRIVATTPATDPYANFLLQGVTGTPYLDIQAGDTGTYRAIALNRLGGNVGIGTTTPTSKLSVYGSAITGPSLTTTAPANFEISQSAGTVLTFTASSTTPYANSIQVRHATVEGWSGPLALNPLGGNVGIGTTAPAAKLNINGTSAYLLFSNGSSTNKFQIKVDANNSLQIVQAGDSLYIQNSAGNNINVFQETGNVGIGLTNPSYRLQVEGGSMFISRSDANSQITIDDGGSAYNDTLYFRNTGTGIDKIIHSKNLLIESSSITPEMYINALNGNVGIGTTTPGTAHGSKLEVTGAIESNSSMRVYLDGSDTIGSGGNFYLANTANNRAWTQQLSASNNLDYWYYNGATWARKVTIDTTGNVGIGTASPATKLHIYQNSNETTTSLTIENSATSVTRANINLISGSGDNYSIGSYESGLFTIRDNSQSGAPHRLAILSSGNVGINTSTPQNTLNVLGNANITGNLYANGALVSGGSGGAQWASSGNEVYNATTGIEVGIGTASPLGKLDIKGTSYDSLFYYGANEDTYIRGGKSGGNVHIQDSNIGNTTINSGGGNVGIGTASPQVLLDVASQMYVRDNPTLASVTAGMRFVPSAGVNYIQSAGSGFTGGADLRFTNYGATNTWMTISGSTGNVGIGTTNPLYKLHSNGTVGITNPGTAVVGGGIRFDKDATPTVSWSIGGNNKDGTLTSDLYIAQFLSSLWTDKVTIQSSTGNVGIGTTNPGGLLQVNSSIGSAYAYFSNYNASGRFITTTQMSSAAGSASIDLRAHGSTYAETLFGNSMADAAVLLSDNSALMAIGTHDGVPLIFGTNNAEEMRITSGGNVGINTTAPKLLLDVKGASSSPATTGTTPNGLTAFTTSNGNALYLGGYTASPYGMWLQAADFTALGTYYPIILNPNGGNVGIGDTTPGSKLEVTGNITLSNSNNCILFASGGKICST